MRSRARAWLERLEAVVPTRRGSLGVFGLGLLVFALRSVALPVIPGRDFGTYLAYYAQMFEWDSVTPMSMLFRTPLAPLVVGGTLDIAGGWGLHVLMGVLFASSIVVWTRVALVFGARAALLTAAALLLFPGYGILFHTPASEPVVATAFALWALALARAWASPAPRAFAVVGLATAATALARPGFQVLALAALVPFVLDAPWRRRIGSALACVGVVIAVVGSWSVLNGLRYDDTTLARGSGAFFPFYRALTTDRIVAPGNGPSSRELAERIERELLPHEPYRSYGVTLDDFFERGSPRLWEDVVGIVDRSPGWDTDYALMRAVGLEAVRAHPGRYASGVAGTILDELWSPLFVKLPESPAAAESQPERRVEDAPALPAPSDGELIPAARQGFFATTPGGWITEVWTSATEHGLVFETDAMRRRYDEVAARAGELASRMPPYQGSAWLTLQFSRSSKLFPPLLLWIAVGVAAVAARRPHASGLALVLAGAAFLVVAFQALAIYAIIEFAVPVAPAFIVLAAAGLLGVTRPSGEGARSASA